LLKANPPHKPYDNNASEQDICGMEDVLNDEHQE
jgi:hypothetical protein